MERAANRSSVAPRHPAVTKTKTVPDGGSGSLCPMAQAMETLFTLFRAGAAYFPAALAPRPRWVSSQGHLAEEGGRAVRHLRSGAPLFPFHFWVP